jgi:hypothetical protein
MLENLELDCEKISDIISVEEIVAINELITDPENFESGRKINDKDTIANAEIGGPEFEINRDEDYHELGSPGVIETLVETMLPMECRKNSNVLWLASTLMTEIAQNQAFYEGNKRTAYMAGSVFLIKIQLMAFDEAIYPMLDKELTDKLSDLAVDGTAESNSIDKEEFYIYLKDRLCN